MSTEKFSEDTGAISDQMMVSIRKLGVVVTGVLTLKRLVKELWNTIDTIENEELAQAARDELVNALRDLA